MAMGEIIKVKFYGDQLWGYRQDDNSVLVALKPIVEGMGLDWASQYQRTKREVILSEGIVMMTIPSEGGDQNTICLKLHFLPGWLFGIDENRVKPEIRDKVIVYKRESYDVLAAHFLNGGLRQGQLFQIIDKKLDQIISTGSDTNRLVRDLAPNRPKVPPKNIRLYIEVIELPPYYGHCPIYPKIEIVRNGQRIHGAAELDHTEGRHNSALQYVWLTSLLANQDLRNPEFRKRHRGTFDAFQTNLALYLEHKKRKQKEHQQICDESANSFNPGRAMTAEESRSYKEPRLPWDK